MSSWKRARQSRAISLRFLQNEEGGARCSSLFFSFLHNGGNQQSGGSDERGREKQKANVAIGIICPVAEIDPVKSGLGSAEKSTRNRINAIQVKPEDESVQRSPGDRGEFAQVDK